MTTLTYFEYQGFIISGNREDKLINLNQIWKAGGSKPSKSPKQWLDTKESNEFISKLVENTYMGEKKANICDLLTTQRGRNGGFRSCHNT